MKQKHKPLQFPLLNPDISLLSCKKPAPGCALCEDCIHNLTRYDKKEIAFCELFTITAKRRKNCHFYLKDTRQQKET